MSFRFLASWGLLLAACGGITSGSGEATPDAATPFDAGVTAASDAASADAGLDASTDDARAADARSDGDAAIGIDASSTCATNIETPSRQRVDLTVTNNATSDRYLVTAGNWCDPFSFSFAQQGSLSLTLGFQCLCECPNPGPARPRELHRLAPGESVTLAWDARRLTTCTQTIDCATMGWPNAGAAQELFGAKVPVTEGSYWASVTALTAVPNGCFGDGTTYNCPTQGGPGSFGTAPSAIQTMCPGDVTATAPFVLPASGDVSVPLAITK